MQIRDVYPGSENFFHPGSASKNLSILTKKTFLSSRKYDPGIRILIFYPSRIPDTGIKKAPDPGSATLIRTVQISECRVRSVTAGFEAAGPPYIFKTNGMNLTVLYLVLYSYSEQALHTAKQKGPSMFKAEWISNG